MIQDWANGMVEKPREFLANIRKHAAFVPINVDLTIFFGHSAF